MLYTFSFYLVFVVVDYAFMSVLQVETSECRWQRYVLEGYFFISVLYQTAYEYSGTCVYYNIWVRSLGRKKGEKNTLNEKEITVREQPLLCLGNKSETSKKATDSI